MSRRFRSAILKLRPATLIIIAASLIFLFLGRGRWVHDSGDQSNWFTDIEGVLHGGRVLHEVWIHFGPLSIWVLSAVCRIFGARVSVVAAAQFSIAVAAAILLLALARNFLDSTEEIVCALVLSVWILWMPGDANIFFPSAFANSQGLLWALGAWWLAERGLRRSRAVWLGLGGVCAGLAFLTKQEWGGVAALGIAAIAIVAEQPEFPRRLLLLFVAGIAAMATVAGILGASLEGESFHRLAERNTLWPFVPVPPGLDHLYQRFQQWDRIADVFWDAAYALVWIAMIGAGVWVVLHFRRMRIRSTSITTAGAAVGGMFLWVLWTDGANFSPLALCAPAMLPAIVVGWRRWRGRPPGTEKSVGPAAAFALGALLLLYRVGYRSMPDQVYSAYGYLLAIPPLVLIGGAVVRRMIVRSGTIAAWSVAAIAAALFAGVAVHRLAILESEWSSREPLRTERGTIWADPKWGAPLVDLASSLRATTRPGDPVFFVPGPRMLDFMLDRRNDSLYPAILGEIPPSTDEALISLWKKTPPRAVVYFENVVAFHRKSVFGRDTGQAAMRWIEAHYRLEKRVARPDSVAYRLYLPISGSFHEAREAGAPSR